MKARIDLHCHLDGSLNLECAYQCAIRNHIVEGDFESFKQKMVVPSDNASLEQYLSCFDLPLQILQDPQSLYENTLAIIASLDKQGLWYAELRFAPQFHTQHMSQKQAIQCVLNAVKDAKSLYSIKINIILCMMTLGPATMNYAANLETVKLCIEYKNQGVVAMDLAGAEEISPMIDYLPLFEFAKQNGVIYTIHAGESGSAANVMNAIQLGAKRIGHGGHCTFDEKVMDEVIKRQIPLEMCPTSNLDCRNQESYAKHAMHELIEKGACVTINTDNATLSNITLQHEFDACLCTENQLKLVTMNAIQAAFISEKEKEELVERVMKL